MVCAAPSSPNANTIIQSFMTERKLDATVVLGLHQYRSAKFGINSQSIVESDWKKEYTRDAIVYGKHAKEIGNFFLRNNFLEGVKYIEATSPAGCRGDNIVYLKQTEGGCNQSNRQLVVEKLRPLLKELNRN